MEYLLDKGGIIIYPLLLVSLTALTIVIERFYQFFRVPRHFSDNLMEQIKEKISKGEIKTAVELCEENQGPVGKVLKQGILSHQQKPEEIKQQMEEIKLELFPKLEKHLGIINFLGKIAPSLGLLGTVTGMIKTFHVLSLNGAPQELAGGISEALFTTAVGLAVSIPTLAAYHYFINKLQQMVAHTEKREIELVNHIIKAGASDGI